MKTHAVAPHPWTAPDTPSSPNTAAPVADASRRRLLGAAPLLAAAGLLWRPDASAAQRGRGAGLVFDVACLGDSFAPNFGGALDMANGDLRGTGFIVEGLIYPAHTIPDGVGFDPASAMATGHWLCRGWFLHKPDRPNPGVVTMQEYLLDIITQEVPSPPETLASSGVETGGPMPPSSVRAITGGTGRYRHARGEVVQEVTGTNTTTLNAFGMPAPNFRFHFRF